MLMVIAMKTALIANTIFVVAILEKGSIATIASLKYEVSENKMAANAGKTMKHVAAMANPFPKVVIFECVMIRSRLY